MNTFQGTNGDGVILAAMAAMFGLFLIGLWCEARRALRRVADRESLALEASLQGWEAEYHRLMSRREARERLETLRAPLQLVGATTNSVAPIRHEDETMYEPAPRTIGFERVGRIIERLGALDDELDDEMEAASAVPEPRFGEFHLVQGGARTPEFAAATSPTRSNAIHSNATHSNATRAA